MLLPSVLPCENPLRVGRSRTTTRSQAQRHATSLIPNHSSIGLGLSIIHGGAITLTPRSERVANTTAALNHLLSLDKTPSSHYSTSGISKSRYGNSVLATPTPSRTPSPQTPSKQIIHTRWTTPSDDSEGDVATPRATTTGKTYTYTIVTRNNKRKRNSTAVSTPPTDVEYSTPRRLNPYTTPDQLATPTVCPPAPKMDSSIFHGDSDDELLDDPFVTPKRTRIRGPASKRISTTRRNLGPWSEEEDKQLVGMVLAKMRLSERDWAECANTIGRDGMSVGERWRDLVEAGSVGLINEKRKEDKIKRARMQGNGRGRLEPLTLRRSSRVSRGIKRR